MYQNETNEYGCPLCAQTGAVAVQNFESLIARLAPEVDAERAWRVGARKAGGSRREYVRLLRAFDRVHGRDGEVLGAAARAVLSPRRRG